VLPQGNYLYDITLRPGASEVWAVGAVGDGVVVFDTTSLLISHDIPLGGTAEYLVDILFSADGKTAYASSRDDTVVAVLDADNYLLADTIALPSVIYGGGKMVLNPCDDTIYMASWYDEYLVTIDPVNMSAVETDIGDNLWDLTVHPDGRELYVIDRGTDELHVVDTSGGKPIVTASISVGDDPWGVDITPDGSLVVVVSEDSATIHIIDTATHAASSIQLPSDADPRDVDISPDGLTAYVPSGDMLSGNDFLYVVDLATKQLANAIDLQGPSNPNVVAVMPPQTVCQQ